MVTLIRTVWSGPNVTGGGVTTMAFEDPVDDTAAAARLGDVETFWLAIDAEIDADASWQVESNPSRYAASTGELQGIFAATGSSVTPGSHVGAPVPRVSQALIRWHTDDIVNGRIVKGRTFVPGIASDQTTAQGGVSSGLIALIEAAAADLISDSGGTLSVWHRPVAGAGGSSHLVTSASVWSEFAALTSRRD